MIKPFEYQKEGINEIWEKFKTNDRVLYQLSTGGGKTFIFSFLTKHWVNVKKNKVLILCHRTELIDQTIASLNRIGVTCEAVTSKVKKLNHDSDCYVAMVETANNRLKKNPYFFKDVGLLIVDECHILIFDKIFSYFPFSKILGCTATPVVLKRIKFFKCKFCKTKYQTETICCSNEVDEWSRPFKLNEIYQDIVVGPGIDKLIEMGRLVKEISFVKDYIDSDKLKTDSDGEFTSSSLDEQYGSDDAVFNVLLNYEKLCKVKKTLVFNNSAKVNLLLYDKFKEAGYNVRMFDSINDVEHTRDEVIKWFKSERDAVLLNVGVFTTGFDVTDIEAIILNRATASLSLFLQMVGRGGRTTDLIYKDSFILIDGGGNINRHQEWSDPTRDWKRIFFDGLGKEKMKKEDAFDVENCENCGAIYAKSEPCCPECGNVIIPKPKPAKALSEDILMPIREIPPPNGEKIYKYTLSKGEDTNFAFKIMISQIVDMFVFYRVTKHQYESAKAKGEVLKKVKRMIQKCYFTLISKQDIKAENNRTINFLIEKTISKLDKLYYL
jgi:superfamily II DNA or RNA helicase